MREIRRPLALATTTAIGAAILTAGIASIGEPVDMPHSAAMIGALGILWGAQLLIWPGRKRGGNMNASNNHMRNANGS